MLTVKRRKRPGLKDPALARSLKGQEREKIEKALTSGRVFVRTNLLKSDKHENN